MRGSRKKCSILVIFGQKGPFWTVFGQNGQNGENYKKKHWEYKLYKLYKFLNANLI